MGRITRGDVVSDLGLDADEAAELATKVAIVGQLVSAMQACGWNQTQLGKAIGMRRDEVSRIVRFDLDHFSIGRLLKAVRALGYRHSFVFTAADESRQEG